MHVRGPSDECGGFIWDQSPPPQKKYCGKDCICSLVLPRGVLLDLPLIKPCMIPRLYMYCMPTCTCKEYVHIHVYSLLHLNKLEIYTCTCSCCPGIAAQNAAACPTVCGCTTRSMQQKQCSKSLPPILTIIVSSKYTKTSTAVLYKHEMKSHSTTIPYMACSVHN